MYRILSGLARLLSVSLLLTVVPRASDAFAEDLLTQSSSPVPMVGFNCKGALKTLEQLTMVRTELRNRQNAGRLVLRVDGGTSSQRNYPADWTDAMISDWVSLQDEFEFPIIFTLNFNDTPESQYTLFQRWKAAGADFALIELMNEPYLPRYGWAHDDPRNVASGFVEVTTVTEYMTPEKYNGLATAFISVFEDEGIPFGAALAPEKQGQQGLYYAAWNSSVIEQLINAHDMVHATLHLYQRGLSFLDLEQIDRIQQRIDPKRLLITEAGVLDLDPYEEFIQVEVSLLQDIIGRLRNGDMLLSQVLYNNYPGGFEEAAFHPNWNGITPKGESVLSLYGVDRTAPPGC